MSYLKVRKNEPVKMFREDVEILDAPTINFGDEDTTNNTATVDENGVEVLELPKMKFHEKK